MADFQPRLVEVPEPTTPMPLSRTAGVESHNDKASFPISALVTPNLYRSTTIPDSSITSSRRSSATSMVTTTPGVSLFDRDFDEPVSEMDWTPTAPTSNFTPRKHIQPAISSITPQPSPFRGSLPAAPVHPYHQAAKPAPKATFFRAPEEKRVQFRKNISGQGNGAFEAERSGGQEMDMAAPKLNLSQQDTGLEGLFSSVFSLSDEPQEVRESRRETTHVGNKGWLGAAFWTVVIAAICSVGVSFWMSVSR
jgi:hypothetical protein